MTALSRTTLTLALLVALSQSSLAENWTRFRGPNGSGIATSAGIPDRWTDEDYRWKTRLPGEGHSSPVVYNDKLFVTSADLSAGQRFLICLDTTDGDIAWKRAFPFASHKKHKNNSFATHTPTVDADRVYVLWQSGDGSSLTAFSHAGEQVWQRDMGPFKGGHGPGTSPIVFQDMVIVCNDQEGPSFLLAVDRKSGETRWQIERSGQRACYSTPCVYQPSGRAPEVIFTHSYQGITAVDPATGRQTWQITPFGTFKQRAIGSPIVAGDLVIGSSGFTTAERNVVAVKPNGDNRVEEVYRVTRLAPHMPTPLVYEQWMFLWDDRGILGCVELATGKPVWQQRVGGNYYGSPICVDGRLFCMDRDGVVVVVAASDDFQILGRTSLGEATCSTPAIADNTIYFRTLSHIFALGSPR